MKNYTHSGLCRSHGCLIAYAEAPTWDQGVLSIETRKMEGKLVSKVEVSHGGFASTRMESVAGKSLTFFPEWAAVPLYHFWIKACHAFLIDAGELEHQRHKPLDDTSNVRHWRMM